MDEILSGLPPGARVLDLGSGRGSFPRKATRAAVVRLDRDLSGRSCEELCVQGDASRLPFRDGSFAVVVSNHSLEHIEELDACLRELGRVIRPDGALYVAVPDASTFTDKLYRWLARGGGHVNAFTSAPALARTIESATGLRHVATRTLFSSLSFLNRRNSPRPLPMRLYLMGAGYEWSLFAYVWLSRRIDRIFRSQTSIYGWAFFFGDIEQPIDTRANANVCVRCGSGCPSSLLEPTASSWPGIRTYKCPTCGARNPFVRDPGL